VLALSAWEMAPASPARTRLMPPRAPRAQTQFMPSGQVARRLNISPRTLGKLTGNIYAVVSGPSRLLTCATHACQSGLLPCMVCLPMGSCSMRAMCRLVLVWKTQSAVTLQGYYRQPLLHALRGAA